MVNRKYKLTFYITKNLNFRQKSNSEREYFRMVSACHFGVWRRTHKISDFEYKDSVSLAIGPEGDFSDYEVDSLTEKGFIPVSIGKRILRAETAAISAISSVRFSAKEF